jgi:hypothetical protein
MTLSNIEEPSLTPFDYFAGLAMQQMMHHAVVHGNQRSPEEIAKAACNMAALMIREKDRIGGVRHITLGPPLKDGSAHAPGEE